MDRLPDFFNWNAGGHNADFLFLQADLALCHSCADLVEREFERGDSDSAYQAFTKAKSGCGTIARRIALWGDVMERRIIEDGLAALRTRLDELQAEFPALRT
jgi:hypothetical protein